MASRSGSVDVFLRLHGQRRFAKELAASGAELEAMGVKGASSVARFAAAAPRLKAFGRAWTRNVSLPVAALSVVAGKMAADFDTSLNKMVGLVGISRTQVNAWKGDILGLSRETAKSPEELADAMFFITSAGLRGNKALEALRFSAKGAAAGLGETKEVADAATSAMNAYGPQTLSAKHATDLLVGAVREGKLEASELAPNIGKVIPLASAMGVSFDEVAASMAAQSRTGTNAAIAATQTRAILAGLLKPSKQAAEKMSDLGSSADEVRASLRQRGLLATLQDLYKRAHGNKAVIGELFPNIRALAGVMDLLGSNASTNVKIFRELSHEAGSTDRAFREAQKAPGFKLSKTWNELKVTLVELGDSLLPAAVPALEKVAGVAGKAADAFGRLPGPVKTAAISLLILTGPVASGLGYFAAGAGRALVLAAGLARAAKSVGIFFTALRAGQGAASAFSIAFAGSGAAGALQTAKGFALALGPALAAVGIGNIVLSATKGDWVNAGIKLGGALVGGVAGFVLSGGNPFVAMLGVGIGSLGGGLLAGLFKGADASPMRRETEHLTDALGGYRSAVKGLDRVEGRASRAKKRHKIAVREERQATRHLTHVLGTYGVNSRRATRAQRKLSEAQRKVTRTAKAEANAHRLSGFRLKAFRLKSLHAAASIKQLLPQQRHRIKVMREEVNHGRTGIQFLNRLEGLERRVGKEKRKLTGIYAEAEAKAGKPWANRLQDLTGLQARYGTKGKVLTDRLREQRRELRRLKETGSPYGRLNRELHRTLRLLEKIELLNLGELQRGQFPGLNLPPLPSSPPGQLPPLGGRPRRGGHHRKGSGQRSGGQPRRAFIGGIGSPSLQALAGGDGDRLFRIEVLNDNNLYLDGKHVARNVTGHVQHQAARE